MFQRNKSREKPTDSHEHRWFNTTTKKEFELVDPDDAGGRSDLYQMVEYAYLMCSCTVVKKVAVIEDIKQTEVSSNAIR